LEPALTEPAPPRLALMVVGSANVGTQSNNGVDSIVAGKALSVHVGYRYRRTLAAGLRGSLGSFGDGAGTTAKTAIPLSLGAFWQYASANRWWLQVSLGLRAERWRGATTRWLVGAGYSIEIGADLLRFGVHNVGLALG